MPETLIEQEVGTTNRPHEITIPGEQLAGNMFGVETPTQEPVQQTTEVKQEPVVEVKKEEPVVEQPATVVNEWYKDYGWDNSETAKSEITKLKEQKPQEIKYENEESKKVATLLSEGKIKEVLDIYAKQEAIEKVVATEVNKDTAAEIIKLNIKLKTGLSKEEVEFQYKQEYVAPKEPIQRTSETDDEFTERHEEWKEKVANIEMKTIIAAKMAKPELEQAKTKIVLPEIPGQQVQQKPPTQEELEAATRYSAAFIQSVESSVKNFPGINVSVKHEGVDIPISYGMADEEKVALSQKLKTFAESNYDVNALFAPRWVKQDGTLNTDLMTKDLLLLDSADKAFQKVASDSSAKTLEAYLKGKKQINVTETFQNQTTQLTREDKTELDEVRDSFFGKTG